MSRKIDSQNTAAKGEKYAGNERPREEHPDARAGAEGRVAGGAEAVLATFGLESGRRAEEDARLARLEAEVSAALLPLSCSRLLVCDHGCQCAMPGPEGARGIELCGRGAGEGFAPQDSRAQLRTREMQRQNGPDAALAGGEVRLQPACASCVHAGDLLTDTAAVPNNSGVFGAGSRHSNIGTGSFLPRPCPAGP
eukprot:949681-Rhodomonas_salina.3